MKRKLPTILTMAAAGLVGVMYWVDLLYYTNPVSGFVPRGTLWLRYAFLVLPVGMAFLGLRTVGPRAISVLRVRSRGLGVLFCLAGVSGMAFGATSILASLRPLKAYNIVLGVMMLWYGVWMLLTAIQLFTQVEPSPTRSAFWGMLGALPFALITVQRIILHPSSIWRIGPMVLAIAALLCMLWFGFLLRSLYIALPRRRVRLTYLCGLLVFLFATCLELPYMLHQLILGKAEMLAFLESLNLAVMGVLAGCFSVSIAGQGMDDAPLIPKII